MKRKHHIQIEEMMKMMKMMKPLSSVDKELLLQDQRTRLPVDLVLQPLGNTIKCWAYSQQTEICGPILWVPWRNFCMTGCKFFGSCVIFIYADVSPWGVPCKIFLRPATRRQRFSFTKGRKPSSEKKAGLDRAFIAEAKAKLTHITTTLQQTEPILDY